LTFDLRVCVQQQQMQQQQQQQQQLAAMPIRGGSVEMNRGRG